MSQSRERPMTTRRCFTSTVLLLLVTVSSVLQLGEGGAGSGGVPQQLHRPGAHAWHTRRSVSVQLAGTANPGPSSQRGRTTCGACSWLPRSAHGRSARRLPRALPPRPPGRRRMAWCYGDAGVAALRCCAASAVEGLRPVVCCAPQPRGDGHPCRDHARRAAAGAQTNGQPGCAPVRGHAGHAHVLARAREGRPGGAGSVPRPRQHWALISRTLRRAEEDPTTHWRLYNRTAWGPRARRDDGLLQGVAGRRTWRMLASTMGELEGPDRNGACTCCVVGSSRRRSTFTMPRRRPSADTVAAGGSGSTCHDQRAGDWWARWTIMAAELRLEQVRKCAPMRARGPPPNGR